MRHGKWLALVLACAMCFGLFAGCKETQKPQGTTTVPPATQAPTTEPATEPTTEPTTAPTEPPLDAQMLMDSLNNGANAEPTYLEALVELEIVMHIPGYGMSMSFDVEMSGEMMYEYDPYLSYEKLEMTMIAMGQKQTATREEYTMEIDGRKVSYTREDEFPLWEKTEETKEEEPDEQEMKPEELLLQEELAVYGDYECHVVSGSLGGEMVREMLDLERLVEGFASIFGSSGDLEESLQNVKVNVNMYFEKDSNLLRGVVLEVEGLDAVFHELATVMADQMGAAVDMEVPVFRIEASGFRYDPVEIPQMSEKDKLQADVMAIEPDPEQVPVQQEDGSYILTARDVSFRLVIPEEWEVDDLQGAMFTLKRPKGNIDGRGVIYTDNNATVQEAAQMYQDLYRIVRGEEFTVEAREPIEGFETVSYRSPEEWVCMMKIPAQKGYLLLEVQSTDGTDPYPYLQELVACVRAEPGA